MSNEAQAPISIAGTYLRRLSEPRSYPVAYAWENQILPICISGIVNPIGPTMTLVGCVRDKTGAPLALVYAYFNPFRSELFVPGYFVNGDMGAPLSDQIASAIGPFGAFAQAMPSLCVAGQGLEPLEVRPLVKRLFAQAPDGQNMLTRLRQFPLNPWDRVSAEMQDAAARVADVGAPAGAGNGRLSDADMDELLKIVLDEPHNKQEVAALFYAWKGAIEQQRRVNNHAEADGAFQHEEFMKLGAYLLEAAGFEI